MIFQRLRVAGYPPRSGMRVSPKGALPPDHGPDFHRMARTCTHSLNTNPKLPHCKTACPLESNTIHRVGRVAIRARAPLYPELRRPYETLLNPYKATKGIAKPKIEIEYQAIVLKSKSTSTVTRLLSIAWRSMSPLINPRSTRYRPSSTALQVLLTRLYSESRSLYHHGTGFLLCFRAVKGACTSKSPITTSH
uniref:Uncharacterized protein n=1 Tax=Trichogramma kaykai TaxID=54128 RepID=A0ABD2WD77_9HYME